MIVINLKEVLRLEARTTVGNRQNRPTHNVHINFNMTLLMCRISISTGAESNVTIPFMLEPYD